MSASPPAAPTPPTTTIDFPWYDAPWLRSYVGLKAKIADEAPELMGQFLDAFEVMRTRQDFEVELRRDLITPDIHDDLRKMVAGLSYSELEFGELADFGRLVVHNHSYVNLLQRSLVPLVSEIVGEPVEPSYNFLSLYHQLGRCEVHMDAPDAKWTVDFCIDQSRPWPISFSKIQPWPETMEVKPDTWAADIKNDPANEFQSFTMEPGDALVFSGSSQWHYRDPMVEPALGDFSHLLFLHYIPLGTRSAAFPAQWHERLPFLAPPTPR